MMEAATGVPTWQVVGDGNGGLQWAAATTAAVSTPAAPVSGRLPSMFDLLLPKLPQPETIDTCGAGATLFQTASGKRVVVSEGSVRRAASVLAGEGGSGTVTSMFQTLSGMPTATSESSMQNARSLLGDEVDRIRGGSASVFQLASGSSIVANRNSTQKAEALSRERGEFAEVDLDAGVCSMFQTGSERHVTASRSSMKTASSLLGEKGHGNLNVGRSALVFQTGSGRSTGVSRSSIVKAKSLLGEAGEQNWGNGASGSMFQTGSGRNVGVSWSSIEKAKSLLREGEEENCGGGKSALMLQTVSENSVSVSHSSMKKAKSLLGEAEEGNWDVDGSLPVYQTGLGHHVVVSRSSVEKAKSLLAGGEIDGGGGGNASMFQMASYRSVSVDESSIQKAGAAIGESMSSLIKGDGTNAALFQTGSGKPVVVSHSSIEKATSILNEDRASRGQELKQSDGLICGLSDSLFQTGAGKAVNITSAGLLKASVLLGLDENCNDFPPTVSEHLMDENDNFKTAGRKTCEWSGSSRMKPFTTLTNGCIPSCHTSYPPEENLLKNDSAQNDLHLDVQAPTSSPSTIKIHSAGGRSLSVTHDALVRAYNILEGTDLGGSMNEESKNYVLPLRIKERIPNKVICKDNVSFASNKLTGNGLGRDGSFSDVHRYPKGRSSLGKPLVEIPSTINANFASGKYLVGQQKNLGANYANSANIASGKQFTSVVKNRLGMTYSTSPFKKPRCSRFHIPLSSSGTILLPNESFHPPSAKDAFHKSRVSTRYPFHIGRCTLLEYFGMPPHLNSCVDVSNEARGMTPAKAEWFQFRSAHNLEKFGVEFFHHNLLQSGASLTTLTEGWIKNHYKWIVWKLACLDRGYPMQASDKLLTVSNVLEELKYRYEREANYGHQSAVKRILGGDAPSASMIILCVSAIYINHNPKVGTTDKTSSPAKCMKKHSCSDEVANIENYVTKIELTDGWYRLNAVLDAALSKHLLSGKIFIGQKLRIWGAGLCGWVGPVSPLEVSSDALSLQLHINGTYRVHWAEKLGFCKIIGAPLSFNCIKHGGGIVPKTLVGIQRIYPILYKERFQDGSSVVRSERLESKSLQQDNQRRASVVEDVMCEPVEYYSDDTDTDEGGKILRILEAAAEPDLLMADMTKEQLTSVSEYQAKREVRRQNEINIKVENALENAGLGRREVTPFLRVRVVGLTSNISSKKHCTREGLITVWNPNEKLKSDLVEGKIYSVTGLLPLSGGSDIIHLQARGSGTIWKAIYSTEIFEPFFHPRLAASLSNLGGTPPRSEFDIAAVVVYVGEAYVSGRQKKQWVFVSDGSRMDSRLEPSASNCSLLAICFCLPSIENDLSELVNKDLEGSTVGFYNLITLPHDSANDLCVADATEYSTYTISRSISVRCHLKEAAKALEKWVKMSPSIIRHLRERVTCILDCCGI